MTSLDTRFQQSLLDDTLGEAVHSQVAGIRVLLVSLYYAPEHSGSAPYTTDLAEHLVRAGAHVDVVTTQPHYPQWRRPNGVAAAWEHEERNGVSVHRVPCLIPADPDLLRRGMYEGSFVAAAARRAARLDPDVVVGCSPGLLAAGLAAAIARLHRRPLLQWMQDVVSSAAEQSGLTAGSGRVPQLLRRLEGAVLRPADEIAVASDAFRGPVAALTSGAVPVQVVRNWSRQTAGGVTDPAQTARLRARLDWTDDRLVVLHTGNLGLKQGIDELVPTLHRLADEAPDLLFAFVGDGNQRRRLEERTRHLTNVRFYQPVSDDDYLPLLRSADVLLVHERSSVIDMSLPSKLTSYVASGVPVLAVVRPDSATGRELRTHRVGVVQSADDPQLLASTVRSLSGTDLGRHYGQRGLHYFAEHLSPVAGLTALERTIGRLAAPRTPARPAVISRTTSSAPLVTVGLPVFQEAARIGRTLGTITDYLATLPGYRWEIVVVDDGSTDSTREVVEAWAAEHADAPPVRIVSHPENRGLGGALQTIFQHARGDALITLDADLSYAVRHVGQLLERWARGAQGPVVVTASPYMPGGRLVDVPRVLALRSRAANRYLTVMGGRDVHTFTAMVRLYDGGFVRSLPALRSGPTVNVEVLRIARQRGVPVSEVPATLDWTGHRHRRARTRVLSRRSLAESWRVVGDGLRLAGQRRPGAGVRQDATRRALLPEQHQGEDA